MSRESPPVPATDAPWRRRLALLLALVNLGIAASSASAELRASAGEGMVALLDDGRISVEAPPLRGEGLIRFVERLCGTREPMREIAALNGGVVRLLRGVRYRVPLERLRPEIQVRAMRALFSDDVLGQAGWRHRVPTSKEGSIESLWQVAVWFTGSGENFRGLRAANQLEDEALQPGQEIVVPRALLRPGLAAALPPLPPGAPAFLEYSSDQTGSFAVYHLGQGEALYSSVVVRFTGRLYADDVNRLAEEIAERSGIPDVRDIPVGYPVKIPMHYLLPEFLPAEHPRRVEYEADLLRSARYSNRVRTRNLEGVTVVLDAGHGGRDVGASIAGIWESTYVYDIMLRVRRLLEASTMAEVFVTTRDGGKPTIPERDVLRGSQGHAVLTTPPYTIRDSRVSTNLRWYLSNSVFARAVRAQRDPDKVVFVSIHADSLHPSLRGAMVYIPGLLSNPPSYGKTSPVYTSRREVRERPRVSFSRGERVRSEGLSRDLARHVLASFRRRGLAVHPEKPVRDRVVRRRRQWVPAVLRFNAVPAKILVEVCNLANAEDRRLAQTRRFREQVAAAIVEGLVAYYGEHEEGDRDVVASQ